MVKNNIIHKIAAVVIEDNKYLLVRKVEKDILTSLGGKPENNETEQEALIREIQEEAGCNANIIRKMGDFVDDAIFDPGMKVKLSVYLVELKGKIHLDDPEIAEIIWIDKDWKKKGYKLTHIQEYDVLPLCKKEGLLKW